MKILINAFSEIFKGSIKYCIPTFGFGFCIILPFVCGALFGPIGVLIALAVAIPLGASTADYCLKHTQF
jgi:hypothetical protein